MHIDVSKIDEKRSPCIRICMDNPSPHLDWNHLRAFLATAECGTLSGAARRLGLTQPTLSRQITAFETSLDLLLFERNARSLTLTDTGRALLHNAKEMGKAATAFTLTASGQRSELSGTVRVTAGDIMSWFIMPQVTQQLRLRAPQITLDVVATDTIQDLLQREADIAIRHVRPEQPALIARLIRQKTAHLYASRSYLDTRGRPETTQDLAHHDWIAMGDPRRMRDHLAGLNIPLPVDAFRVASENGLIAWEMAKTGLGIIPMDDDVAAKTPQMEQVLSGIVAIEFPVWLVTHRELHTSPRIRLVFDLLAELLA